MIWADELGATLDRITAKVIARHLRRRVRRSTSPLCLIVATTHDGLLESSEPQVLMFKGLGSELELCRGGWKDYPSLQAHHYKAQRPATATRVLVLRHHQPDVVQRFRRQASGADASAHHGEPTTVAVLVESLPSLSCRMRDEALRPRYRSMVDVWQRAQVLHEEVRCIRRVVVHPPWRGLGAGGAVGA